MPQPILCAVALVLVSSAGLWAFYSASPAGAPPAAPQFVEAPRAAPRPAAPTANVYGALIHPTFETGHAPLTFAQSAPPGPDLAWSPVPAPAAPPAVPVRPQPAEAQIVPPLAGESNLVQTIPLPPPRPAVLLPKPALPLSPANRAPAQEVAGTIPPAPPSDRPSFFEKLFGGARPPGTALGYAPEDGGLGTLLTARPQADDRLTAVYDISAHMVYLPDGTRLEAHSGLGAMIDDPRSVGQHMRGATPPNTYELQPREALFHGVRALRLNPVGPGDTYGRGGLLAHTFMLGPHGDSNGCVVFRNYQAFLAAFDRGQVKRLVVVARMN